MLALAQHELEEPVELLVAVICANLRCNIDFQVAHIDRLFFFSFIASRGQEGDKIRSWRGLNGSMMRMANGVSLLGYSIFQD